MAGAVGARGFSRAFSAARAALHPTLALSASGSADKRGNSHHHANPGVGTAGDTGPDPCGAFVTAAGLLESRERGGSRDRHGAALGGGVRAAALRIPDPPLVHKREQGTAQGTQVVPA